MARDHGLETMLGEELNHLPGMTQKRMFGGMAWLLDGRLLCAARSRGILVRLGKGNDAWALAVPGIAPMVMHGRSLSGWVNVAPEACGDEDLRHSLLEAALRFVRSLPPE